MVLDMFILRLVTEGNELLPHALGICPDIASRLGNSDPSNLITAVIGKVIDDNASKFTVNTYQKVYGKIFFDHGFVI